MRVSVYWSDDEQYYDATVVKERKDKNHPHPYKLEYGDGEYEWIDLYQHKFRFLNSSGSKEADLSPTVRKSGRRRRLPSRMREEDDDSESSSSDDDDDDDDVDDDLDDEVIHRTRANDSHSAEVNRVRESTKKGSHVSSSSSETSSSETPSSSDSEEDSDIELVSDVRQVQLGSRVAVYWSDHERYYEGTITEHRKGHPMPYFISYDDGDSQYIDLRRRNFCILKKVRRKKQKRKERHSHSSDSSGDELYRSRSRTTFTARKHSNRQPQSKYGSRSEATSDSSDTTDDDDALDTSTSVALKDPTVELDLGTRVTVFCPVRKKYLDGTVTHRQIPRNCTKKLCYYVEYDRGHREWIEVPTRKVRLLKSSEIPLTARKPLKRGRKKVHDSPLLRLLRQKELRKANPDLIQGMEIDKPAPSYEEKEIPESESSSSSSSEEESEDPSSADDSSDEEKSEKEEIPNKHLLAAQIGIGSRIAVQCPRELKFMEGSVTRLIRNRRKPFFVEYDIGGFEWIDVHSSVVKILTVEEEKSLKEKSAILAKEEVEIEDEVNIVQPDVSDGEKEKEQEKKDAMDVDSEPRKAEVKQDNFVAQRDSVDEDPDQAPPSPVIAVDERKQSESRRSSGSKEDHGEETTLPSLQDEDSSHMATCSTTMPPQNGSVVPSLASKASVETADGPRPPGNVCTNIDVARVGEFVGSNSSDKRSPTAVTCVLGSTAAEKIVNGVAMKSTIEPGHVAGKLPKCILLKSQSNGVADEAKENCMLARSSSPSTELVRVPPVAIVSDTSADRHEVHDKFQLGKVVINGNQTASTTSLDKPIECHKKHAENAAEIVSETHKNAKPEETGAANSETKVTTRKVSDESENRLEDKSDKPPMRNGETPKRKRGRPPKNNPALPNKGDDKSDEKKEETLEAVLSPDSVDVPRKRGRPPRTPPTSAHDSAKSDIFGSDEAETPKRRGPGRPPKKATPSSSTGEKEAEVPKKRGPGRPPKNSPFKTVEKAKEDLIVKASDDESENEPTVKRGPGRPRKSDPEPKKRGPGRPPSKGRKSEPARVGVVDLTSETVKPEVPKKRGPGRPRKNPLPDEEKQVEAVVADGSAQKKRGPGRPRKSETEEPKKRGPGRPRKSPKKEEEVAKKPVEDIFKTTTVEGSRPRKEPNRFSPTQFEDSDSDSSSDGGSPGARSTPGKKSDFGEEHAKLASQLQVGMRVSVFWGGDKEYYPGTITRARSYRKKKFYLEYDDGEAEWIDFHRNKFKLLSQPKVAAKKRKAGEASDDDSTGSAKRRASDTSDTDRSSLIRNRMDMAEVMSKIKIGCRVEVFWSEDDCYYPGTITKQRDNIITSKKPFYLQYDDGESEWIDLRDHVFRLIEKDEITPETVESAASIKDKRKREKEAEDAGAKKMKRLKKRKVLE